MLEFLGWILFIYLVGALIIAVEFLPGVKKVGDPSGGLLQAYIGGMILVLCLTWPVSLPWLAITSIKKKITRGKNDTV